MRYYDLVREIFETLWLPVMSEKCWMIDMDILYRALRTYRGRNPVDRVSVLILEEGRLYNIPPAMADILVHDGLIEVFQSPIDPDTKKLNALFDELPKDLGKEDLQQLRNGIEIQINGRRAGCFKTWNEGTRRLLETIESIKRRTKEEVLKHD